MIRGIYTSASGMLAKQQEMNIVSNNLSNINTTGFKEKLNVFKAYPENDMVRTDDRSQDLPPGEIEFRPPIGSLSTGVASDGTYTNFRQGSLTKTDNPMDVALEGNGFFTVQLPEGERAYTRDGSFKLNDQNQVVTSLGRRVLGTEGNPIQLPGKSKRIEITPDGTIFDADNQEIGQFRIVQFENPQKSREMGENLYRQGQNNEIQFPPEDVKVHQGMLERSNTNPINQMTRMIEVSRQYDMNSNVLGQHNSTLQEAITTVGRG